MGNIFVGMDSSNGAAAALRWAVNEAGVRGWDVTAVLAWSYLDQPHADVEEPFDPVYGEKEAREVLDRAVEQSVGPDVARSVGRKVVCDLAANGLLAAADDADLLVVGARGLGGFRALLLGSVSEQVLHHATCPVAVIRTPEAGGAEPEGAPDDGTGRVVVGIDGSESAQRALHWALAEARARRAPVTVVHAWRQPIMGIGPPTIPVAPEELEAAAEKVMDDALAREDTSDLPEPVERVTPSGPATQAILHAAKGAGLVVVGTRGHGGFTGLLLGSVSHQVTHHARCPVVVVPGADRA